MSILSQVMCRMIASWDAEAGSSILATIRPARITRMRSLRPISSFQILARNQNAETSISSLAQRLVDLGPRSDIHATGRTVQQEHAGIDREAFAQHHLLQVAPAERARS